MGTDRGATAFELSERLAEPYHGPVGTALQDQAVWNPFGQSWHMSDDSHHPLAIAQPFQCLNGLIKALGIQRAESPRR